MSPHHHNLFGPSSELYAAARPHYPEELFEFLARQCKSLDACWDCATGSGQAATSLAAIFSRVEATDVNATPLEHGAQHPKIHYSQQPAEQTNFAAHSFDLITVAQALHWFDRPLFWAEVERVLKPGGVFAAWGYSWPHVSEHIDEVVQKKLRDVIEPFWAAQNRDLWNGYRSMELPFVAIPTPSLELVPQWDQQQFLEYLGTWSATRRCLEAKGETFFQEFKEELAVQWQNPQTVRRVQMEFHFIAGRK